MNDKQLMRKLNSVGKIAFVEHFKVFKNYSSGKLTKEKSIELLVSKKISNEAGAAIRLGNAKAIFESNKEHDALVIVSESSRLHSTIVNMAKQLLKEH